MSSVSTPSTSAAICASTVSAPVPRSVAPTSRLNEPSSFILIDAEPMSTNGMPVPCMQSAKPMPRRMLGRSGGHLHSGSSRRSQPIACRAWATHSSVPQLVDPRHVLGGDLVRGAALAESWGDVERIADADPVRAPELDRVEVERARDVLHVALEGEQRLRGAVAAERARDRTVRVDDVAGVALGRAVVRRRGRGGR